MVERRKPVRVTGLHGGKRDEDLAGAMPSERISMVWPLTIEAWVFKDESDAGSRLQRHTVRVFGNK